MEEVIVYNPKNGSPIKNFAWANAKWEDLGVNEVKKYPAHVGQEMVKRFGFLREIKPEDLPIILQEMKAKSYKCPHCDFETNSKQKLQGHELGKHKLTKETKDALDGIKSAGKVDVRPSSTPKGEMTIEEMEGIPDTKAGEVDNWYGGGLEVDKPTSMTQIRPGAKPGHFGAS